MEKGPKTQQQQLYSNAQDNEDRFEYLYALHESAETPEEAYRFNPSYEDKMFVCDKHIQRLIFYGGQEWLDWEQEHLDKFGEYMRQHNLELPQTVKVEEIVRNLQAAQFNYKHTHINITRSVEWRKHSIPIALNTGIEELITSGFLYIYGRDRNFRPMIIIRPRIIASKMRDPHEGVLACTFMMEYVRNNLFLPGQVENWILMIDLDGLSLVNVPYKALKLFMETLQGQYRCTSSKIFILKVNTLFNLIWKTIRGFLEEHTKKKIFLTKEKTCKELMDLFEPCQLEEKYGGEAQDFQGPFWPPRMPSKHAGVDEAKLVPIEQYEEFYNSRIGIKKMPDELMPKINNREELKVGDEFIVQRHHKISYENSECNDVEEGENFMISEIETLNFSKRIYFKEHKEDICKHKALTSFGSVNKRMTHHHREQDSPILAKVEDTLGVRVDSVEVNEEEKQQNYDPDNIHGQKVTSQFGNFNQHNSLISLTSSKRIQLQIIDDQNPQEDDSQLLNNDGILVEDVQFEINLSNRMQKDTFKEGPTSHPQPLMKIEVDQFKVAQRKSMETHESKGVTIEQQNNEKKKQSNKPCCQIF